MRLQTKLLKHHIILVGIIIFASVFYSCSMFINVVNISTQANEDTWMYAVSSSNRSYTEFVDLKCDNAFYKAVVTNDDGSKTTYPVFKWGTRNSYCALSPFSICKYEVTYGLWYEVVSWAQKHDYYFDNRGKGLGRVGFPPTEDDNDVPVNGINWYDAAIWCNAYSQMCGLEPCYYYEDGTIAKDSSLMVYDNDTACLLNLMDYSSWKKDANGFRLPTLAEWECAASGGFTENKDVYPGTNNFSEIKDYAWLYEESLGKYQKVGTKKPNSIGVFDLGGNTSEWVYNFYKGSNSYTNCTTQKMTINGTLVDVYYNPIGLTIADVKTGNTSAFKHICGTSTDFGNDSSSNTDHHADKLDSCSKVTYNSASVANISGNGFRVVKNLK